MGEKAALRLGEHPHVRSGAQRWGAPSTSRGWVSKTQGPSLLQLGAHLLGFLANPCRQGCGGDCAHLGAPLQVPNWEWVQDPWVRALKDTWGAAAHFIRRARSPPWPRCGVWGSSLRPVSSTRASGAPLTSHPLLQTGLVGNTALENTWTRKAPEAPADPSPRRMCGWSLAAHSGTALLRLVKGPAARGRQGHGCLPGGRCPLAAKRGGGQLRAVGVCLHHLAVHGHGEGQAQDLRGQHGLGRATQDHGQRPVPSPHPRHPRWAGTPVPREASSTACPTQA